MAVSAAVVTAVVAAAGTTYSAVNANQQAQHTKGAAQAQKTAADAKIAEQQKIDQQTQVAKAQQGSTTQQAAMSALKASMRAASTGSGTILTGPLGAAPVGTTQKTLLGA